MFHSYLKILISLIIFSCGFFLPGSLQGAFAQSISGKADFLPAEKDSFVTVAADTSYLHSEKRWFWLGRNYRETWATPVKARVFNISEEKGGLEIVKEGGGQQTSSLRLEGKNGRQYVLRSIRKTVEGAMPEEFYNTVAVDLVQDFISASNPYAAVVVAQLAEFAGVYHTNPEIVYLPDDPALGEFREDFARQLYLFEERPDENWEHLASFGHSKNIVSTATVVEDLYKNSKYRIDVPAVIRARLFDIVINDWDRHDDQWRWASYETDSTTLYRPIPRDRDQAFFVNQGVIPWIAARKWLMPKIQGFDHNTDNVEGLAFNARYFDRTFLVGSTWQMWEKEIDFLTDALTIERINEALKKFPVNTPSFCLECTSGILDMRLGNLHEMARKLFLSVMEEVNITGTNDEDVFEIRMDNEQVKVTLSSGEKEDDKESPYFSNVFSYPATREIKMYGFEEEDKFIFSGNGKSKIKMRLMGGGDDDELEIKSGLPHPGKLKVYDNSIETKNYPERWVIKKYDEEAVEYNRKGFEYDMTRIGVMAGYNIDDGILIGGGPVFMNHGQFFASEQKILANFSVATRSSNFSYEGRFQFPAKNMELNVLADVKAPNYTLNYFGMGNETQWRVPKSEKDYYRLRIKQYHLRAGAQKRLFNKNSKLGMALEYKNFEVEDSPGRFIADLGNNGLEKSVFNNSKYAAVCLVYDYSNLDEQEFAANRNILPGRGQKLHVEYQYNIGLENTPQDFSRLSANWSFFYTIPRIPRLAFALRAGGTKNFGEYRFYEAAKLGGKSNLRGFRATRFYGDAAVYQNTDIRFRLSKFSTYLLAGSYGILAFNDVGRVFYNGENSQLWHHGYGGGVWIAPFNLATLTVSYAASRDDAMLQLGLNYLF